MMKIDISKPIYTNEEAARKHLEKLRWPENISCPFCTKHEKVKPTTMKNKPSAKNPNPKPLKGYYHCGACRVRFTVRTGTIYERSHIPLHKWVLATQLLCSSKKGMSAHQLHRMLGMTYKTAWFMAHRIREAMMNTSPSPIGGKGESVQADETYFGRKDVIKKYTKYGRPTHSGKMSVVALVSNGKSKAFHVESANLQAITEILKNNVRPETELHTDESYLYKRIGKEFAAHKTVRHASGEYKRNGAHTNNVENYFSIFKRGMTGVYQRCSERHLQRYLNEFDFRYSNRDINDFERSDKALRQAEGKRLTYKATKSKSAA